MGTNQELNWKAEAMYWHDRHRELVDALDELAFGRTDHPDGIEVALLALQYEHTVARPLSPSDGAALAEWLNKRTQGAGDVQG